MKKIITLLALIGVVSVEAGSFVTESFLAVPAVWTGTNNEYAPTNLLAYGSLGTNRAYASWGFGTNQAGVNYTNNVGTLTTVNTYSTASNAPAHLNLLSAVSLPQAVVGGTWAQNGLYNWWSTTNALGDQLQTTNFTTPASLFIRYTCTNGHAAATTYTFRFAPMIGNYIVSGAATDWAITVAGTWGEPAKAAQSLVVTNIPTYKWPGVEKLALVSITPAAGGAYSAAWVTDCKILYYKP